MLPLQFPQVFGLFITIVGLKDANIMAANESTVVGLDDLGSADVVLAIVMMPFAYSIATDIMFGILSWVVFKVVMGKIKEIHRVMWVAYGLFVLRVITIVMGISSYYYNLINKITPAKAGGYYN